MAGKTIWIGYSGGLDSHVLLHMLASMRLEHKLNLHAVHINHSLSPLADQWVEHCKAVCLALHINFSQYVIAILPKQGESLEAIARQRRYEIFENLLAPNDILLTAHHQDDQAETVLLQMLRGAGPKGLSAMPVLKSFGKGFQIRPLLNMTRIDLKKYAEKNNLSWIEDESNNNICFSRNFIRHEIFPILKKRWPSVTNILARVATQCAETQEIVDEIAAEDLAAIKVAENIFIPKLLMLTPARQRQVVRAWLRGLHFPVPSATQMQQIQSILLQARLDKTPYITWGGIELRRYQNRLYAMHCLPAHDPKQIIKWDVQKPLELIGMGVLHPTSALQAITQLVTVRFRQGGEVYQLPGRTCHHTLKHLFQEWKVPPWERDRVPLLYVDDELVAVIGYENGGFVAEVTCQQSPSNSKKEGDVRQ